MMLHDEDLRPFKKKKISVVANGDIRVMFLGGGAVDAKRRERFSCYGFFVAGNHLGCDVYGDWNTDKFWEDVKARSPTSIVVDGGSDSWLNDESFNRLIEFVHQTNVSITLSPWKKAGSECFNDFKNEHNPGKRTVADLFNNDTRFIVSRVDSWLLFTVSAKLPEQSMFPLEVLAHFNGCHSMQACDSVSAVQRKDTYASLEVLGRVACFDDHVADHLSQLKWCH